MDNNKKYPAASGHKIRRCITLSFTLLASVVLAACGGGGGGDDSTPPPSDNAALSVSKSLTNQSSSPVIAGTVLSYTVSAQNTGNIALSNVVVSDDLISPASQTCASLAINAICELSGTYTVTTADETSGQVQNTATADSNETAPVDSNTVNVGVNNNPALSVSKSLSSQSTPVVTAGTVLNYTITAQNTGNVPLTDVVVNDSLIAPSSQNCGTVAVNATCVLSGSYTVVGNDQIAGEVENTATANSNETSEAGSNTVTVSVESPSLSVEKALSSQSNNPATEGTVLNYTVTMRNTGTVALSNVVVNDPLTTPSSQNCASVAVNATCVLTGSYTVTAPDVAAGQVQNTATADSDETAEASSNTVTVSVETGSGNPALNVSKVLSNQSATPVVDGTVLTYTVTAQNTGDVALSNVVVSDPLITPGNQNCGSVAVNATCVLNGSYTVTTADATAGQVQNTATADSDETAEASSNTVTVTVDNGNSSDTGLDSRPSNTSCIAPERPSNASGYRLESVFTQLRESNGSPLLQPLFMGQPPGDSSRWFVAKKGGEIISFENTPNVSVSTTVLQIDVVGSPDEGGLLGFAFAPDFATSGQAYVSYTRNVGSGGVNLQSIVSRFTSADGGLTLNAASEQEILVINHPDGNHNGGGIHFGPDGYLYLGMGDGGGFGDPFNNGQDTTNLLGTFIRVDVSGGGPGYSIPPDNPFAGNPICTLGSGSEPCPEIYAWGLRNPFRWSFDRDTGDLWAGDVGNIQREEVDLILRGGNYGWKIREGTVCLNPSIPPENCAGNGLIDPVVDYPTGAEFGRSVIGGYVYRGETLADLRGRYIFGDPYSSNIYTIEDDGNGNKSIATLIPNVGKFIAGFAESLDGDDLFVVNLSGSLEQLVEDTSSGANTIPDLLSETGCVDSVDPTQPASGLIPYTPSAPFWSDGANKPRWLAIPDGTSITVDNDDDFIFPAGTVLVKNFERQSKLIETRLFMRHPDGVWAGYTYRWNDAETEATRVIGGATLPAGGSDWIYPSESQCLQCHTDAANRALGLEVAQLNNSIQYPSTGRTANQLATLDGINLLSPPLGDVPANLPAYPDPFGSAPLEDRARAYLHTNCSGCHRPGTPLQTTMDLRYQTSLPNTQTCNADPITGGTLGIANKLITPGNADASLIRVRMGLRDANAMPPIGSLIPDDNGVALIEQWINSLDSGDCS